MAWLRHTTPPRLRQRLLPRDLGILAAAPVWTRNLRLVVPLNQVPLEEYLIAVAGGGPAGPPLASCFSRLRGSETGLIDPPPVPQAERDSR
jgi:hypothetical protein